MYTCTAPLQGVILSSHIGNIWKSPMFFSASLGSNQSFSPQLSQHFPRLSLSLSSLHVSCLGKLAKKGHHKSGASSNILSFTTRRNNIPQLFPFNDERNISPLLLFLFTCLIQGSRKPHRLRGLLKSTIFHDSGALFSIAKGLISLPGT